MIEEREAAALSASVGDASASLNKKIAEARAKGLRVDVKVEEGPSTFGFHSPPEDFSVVEVKTYLPLKGRSTP